MFPPEGGAVIADLMKSFGASFKMAQGPCMKNKWIKMEKAEGKLYRNIESISDSRGGGSMDFDAFARCARGASRKP